MYKKSALLVGIFFFILSFTFTSNASLFVSEKEKASRQFSTLANDYENSFFEYTPELGLFLGKPNVALDRFMDYSEEATKTWQKREDNFLLALRNIDEKALRDSPQYITYLLLKDTLENIKKSRVCKNELWDVNPAFGWHNKMAILAEKQPVTTAEYRALALKRWRTFPKVVDVQINNLKKGIALGYTAPIPAITRVLTQLKITLENPIEESPYFSLARRSHNSSFKEDINVLIKEVINPSLEKYVNYLKTEYIPYARKQIGVSALPLGSICYQSKIKLETTLDLSPYEIHALGLQQMDKIAKEVGEIGLKKYKTREMAVIFQHAKEESSHDFSSEQDILNYNLAALKKVNAKLTHWFDLIPKSEGTIKPYPAHRAKTGASGEYHPPSDDGREPGIFYINTYEPKTHSRIDQEATLFHELIPGHHFQIALSYEDKSLPSLNKYLWNSGFGEGWALYVERLADEMGLYQDDISRLGMLSNEALRAARLVVDTGIHAMNWSRKEAVEYLAKHTALSDNIIEGEVDRYIMMPGQATAYMLGKLEIERLREQAKKQLGIHFDIRQFHNQILKNGVVNLPILRAQVETWLLKENGSYA